MTADSMTQEERRIYLIKALAAEIPRMAGIEVPVDESKQKYILRALMNIRMPAPVSDEVLAVQDAYLQEAIREKGITDIENLTPLALKDELGCPSSGQTLYLWKGDITTLKCGAIVNAANSGMLGCFQPCHNCIDNCIHTYAGMQLRLECERIMRAQGNGEPTGQAKITGAYNLPSNYILHTVGPIVYGRVTEENRQDLKSCYTSCLDLAQRNSVGSTAFCCISTGVFGYPAEQAARVAVQTVRDWLSRTGADMKVIFNVFSQRDYDIYSGILGQ